MKEKSDRRLFLEKCAREMRNNPTDEEKKVWYGILRKIPVRSRRQVVIGDYIVDFLCTGKRVIIEIDGIQHYSEEGKQKDGVRDDFLRGLGYTVLRIANVTVNDWPQMAYRDICALVYPEGLD
ncbi:MAG: DUF559 domain-containing protein [Clostridia bacterium]|nr:DUF559 domain-containing protein [Clostridia bacterium]